jgi:LysR family hydrogen peroxide-inducible transcriptional activator
MITIKQLRYLTTIADTRHFGRAAQRCGVSQPTLSGQLQTVERNLGVKLVERSRQRVILTPIGREIASRARRILQEVDDLVEVSRHGLDLMSGTLRLGVLPTIGPYLLPLILPTLHDQHPALKIFVREGMRSSLLTQMEDGKLEALLIPLPVSGGELAIERLFYEDLLVAVPADHRLAGQAHVERAQLRGERVLTLEPGHRLHDQVADLCRRFGAAMLTDFEGTSLDTLRLMVGMGAGISFLPALYVRSETPKDDQVRVLDLEPQGPRRLVGLVWRQRSAHAREFRQLARSIRQVLADGVPEVTVVS